MIWQDQGLSIHLGLIGGEISWERPLGNDGLGRNLLLLILKGVVTTAPILWSLAILSIFAGWLLGALMVYHSPKLWVSALEKVVLKLGAVPMFLLVLLFSILSGEVGIEGLIYSLSVTLLIQGARTILRLYSEDHRKLYWQAHKSFGGSKLRRILSYGFSQLWFSHLKVELILVLQMAIITEVSLSYLGLGIQEPGISLGNLLAANLHLYMSGDVRILMSIGAAVLLVFMFPKWVGGISFKRRSTPPERIPGGMQREPKT